MQNLVRALLLFLVCSFASYAVENPLQDAQQLIVVVSKDWNSPQAQLVMFTRDSNNAKWEQLGNAKPVVVGNKGMAWGRGVYQIISNRGDPIKLEGDQKAPAGIFSFGTLFGSATMTMIKMPYLKLNKNIEGVDDPKSKYYNQIVDTKRIKHADWNSSEKMGEIDLYAKGVVLNHNTAEIKPYAGSQIFMHIWRDASTGTAGCTAMAPENMQEIFFWLDETKNPRLVQMPLEIYNTLADSWQFPPLPAEVEQNA